MSLMSDTDENESLVRKKKHVKQYVTKCCKLKLCVPKQHNSKSHVAIKEDDPKIIYDKSSNSKFRLGKKSPKNNTVLPLLRGHPFCRAKVASQEGWPLVRGKDEK